MLNRRKVWPLANAKSNKFFQESVALNVMSLWKCKKIIAYITAATSYGNHHSLVSTFFNISLLVMYFVKDEVFQQPLGRGMKIDTILRNVFEKGTTSISIRITLDNYLNWVRGNCQNVKMQANNVENDSIDDIVKGKGYNIMFNTEN